MIRLAMPLSREKIDARLAELIERGLQTEVRNLENLIEFFLEHYGQIVRIEYETSLQVNQRPTYRIVGERGNTLTLEGVGIL